MRTRILARFTELEAERAAITAQLAKLESARQPAPDLDLLDQLPIVAGLITSLPTRLHAQLYDTLALGLLYHHDQRQAAIHAVITTSARAALAEIIRQCDTLSPALAAALSDLEHNPGTPGMMRDQMTRAGSSRSGSLAWPWPGPSWRPSSGRTRPPPRTRWPGCA
jgi:hypothetical protein